MTDDWQCGELMGFLIDAERTTEGTTTAVLCTERKGHEKPDHPECSCGRHDVTWWAEGTPHKATITTGAPIPLTEEQKATK